MEDPLLVTLRDSRDLRLVGGKALRLAQLLDAGFPVPDGFVVTAAAYRAGHDRGSLPAPVAQETVAWYRRLGSPPVAVRSSATAEDQADASMAGQYQTILDVAGEAALLAAIEHCWSSVDSERTRAYLTEHGLEPSEVTMAVVVQQLVPADVAGVLFTANPRTGAPDEMLIEASWGLGEALVSGQVQPDTLVLDSLSGRVKTASIAEKRFQIISRGQGPGSGDPRTAQTAASKDGCQSQSAEAGNPWTALTLVPDDQRNVPCLTSQQVYALWQLGIRVADHFGSPQDLEWAIHGQQVLLLQSRPITTLAAAGAYRRCLEQTQSQLRQDLAAGRGPWVRHNLAETLPHPTPLTWSLIRRFMSGAGGLGGMYQLAGFQSSAAVRDDGFLDLIAGRVYMDLSRAPDMFFPDFPYRYDLDLLRVNPDAAHGPPTIPCGPLLQQVRINRRLAGIQRRLEALSRDADQRLDKELIPAFVAYAAAEKQRDLTQLETRQWLELWRDRERRVLDEFAPQSLLPSLIAAMALARLRALLEEHFWDEDPLELGNLLSSAGEPDETLRASQQLYELAVGDTAWRTGGQACPEPRPEHPLQELRQELLTPWLERYGHRAPDEFDLASPRWRERPAAVAALAQRLQGNVSPLALHERHVAEANRRLQELGQRLAPAQRRELEEQLQLARRYLRFREDGKHYLMLGYQLLRDLALEAGRRLGIAEDVFLLTFAELQESLTTGFAPLQLLEQRRVQRKAEAKMSLRLAIGTEEIESLGQPPARAEGHRIPAFPISAGSNQGPARIVLSPPEAGDLGRGYVLVCPSTDPSWTPLFVNAAALVMECGGTLSHGAVVARELGIPAVVCEGATERFRDGELLQVDGHHGAIVRPAGHGEPAATAAARAAAERSPEQVSEVDPRDTVIPRRLVPPVVGRRERRAARLRNLMLLTWSLYLIAAFVTPAPWVYDPSLELLDGLLWPIVAAWGKPAVVMVAALGLAVFTMVGQRLLTDTGRLRVAKHRAAQLRRLARQLPADAPRRQALLALARPVQTRILMAGLLPLALILGPMVMSFLWFPQRVDPASWNARPGATVYVVATVDGEFTAPIRLEHDPALTLEEGTPATQSLPPLRATLEERLARWQRSSDLSGLPWEVQEAGRWISKSLATDLGEYLSRDLPPQSLAWTLYTPHDRPGRFRITLWAGAMESSTTGGTRADRRPFAPRDVSALRANVVVGDAFPPQRREDLGDGKGPVQVVRPAARTSPIKLVKVTYFEPKKQARPMFWTPLAGLGWPNWDTGWLLAYLLAYLPAMFLLRWLLRLP